MGRTLTSNAGSGECEHSLLSSAAAVMAATKNGKLCGGWPGPCQLCGRKFPAESRARWWKAVVASPFRS